MDFKSLTDPVTLVGDEAEKHGFFNKIRPPSTGFFNKKILGGALTVFLLFAVGLGVYLSQQPTNLIPFAQDSRSELSIRPPTKTASFNDEVISDVFINTQGKIVSKVVLVIDYNPLKLKLIDASPGTFLDETLEITPREKADGHFSIRLQKKLFGEASGSGVLVSLKFKVLSELNEQTSINFDQKATKVTIKDEGDKDKVKYFESQALILNPTGQIPNASPEESTVPSYSPSESPQQSPSASPSPSTSPSPSPAVSPSPSPEFSASASPSPAASVSGGQKGDGNNDGVIDRQDLSLIYTLWSPATDITSHFQVDFNDDLKINSYDLNAMKQLLFSLGVIKGVQ